MPVNKILYAEAELRTELEGIYAEHPELRDHHVICCGGCAESDLGYKFGWGHPIVRAYERVDMLRFLLGDKQ